MHFNAEQINTVHSHDHFLVRVELGIWCFDASFSPVNNTTLKSAMYWLQALLEMDSEEAAAALVNHCNFSLPHLHSQPVYIQYSKHRELKIKSSSYQAVSIVFPFTRIELHISCMLLLAKIVNFLHSSL